MARMTFALIGLTSTLPPTQDLFFFFFNVLRSLIPQWIRVDNHVDKKFITLPFLLLTNETTSLPQRCKT